MELKGKMNVPFGTPSNVPLWQMKASEQEALSHSDPDDEIVGSYPAGNRAKLLPTEIHIGKKWDTGKKTQAGKALSGMSCNKERKALAAEKWDNDEIGVQPWDTAKDHGEPK
jgi:hypothetical protein